MTDTTYRYPTYDGGHALLQDLRTRRGVGDMIAVWATLTYPGEEPRAVVFTAPEGGGPIVMTTPSFQEFVDTSVNGGDRELNESWVLRFFGAEALA